MTAVDASPLRTGPPPVGVSSPRRDGPRLAAGRARYLADFAVPGLCHVAILRSPHAHAEVAAIDTAAARALPGVIAVVTQAELVAAGARPFDHLLGPPARPLRWGVLASDRVRFVGEPLGAVVAVDRAVAEDALELIEVDYRELPAVVGVEEAAGEDAPLLYPEWGDNVLFDMAQRSPGLDDALAAAPHRLSLRVENHRVCGLPLEGHGVQAEWDPGRGRLRVVSSNQQPHQLRSVIAEVCDLDEAHVSVVSPDMGGGFGNKQHFTREECLVALLARMVGRPVRWSQDRTESLTASVHSRAQVHHVEAGYDDTGRLLALDVRILSDVGNPVLYFAGVGPAMVTVSSLSGAYAVAHLGWHLSCVATNTCPVGAYRGFGQPEAHLTAERVMDAIAGALGLDPVEVRRVNLLPDQPRPWRGHGGQRIDPGSLGEQFEMLLDRFDYRGWRARQAAARAAGRYVGIGVSTLVQGTTPTQNDTAGRFGSLEMASVTVLPDGRVDVRVGTKSQGQAHETVFAQLAAAALGVDEMAVHVHDGDTDALAFGQGTWGSRSAVMGGGAVLQAAGALRARMASLAAGLGIDLPAEGPLDESAYRRVAEVAWWHPHLLPPGSPLGLAEIAVYSPGFTGPQAWGGANHDETYGSHATGVAVEVDPVTGDVKILDALLVSDCGVVVNPAVVVGQHQGGFAQGLGAALYEEIRYNPDGQPLSTTLLDYAIPTATDVPVLAVVHRPTPSELLGGMRGVGEASIIAAPAVLVSAVEDALAPIGVRLDSTRLHARYLRAAVRAAGWRPDAAAWATAEDLGHIPRTSAPA
ncbi:MAG: xanthine dehydrogenase family protein [Acidobacteriota bacterium]|nr:xanthine dehydrogenase family protein [Acidobacteriota bacterium]